MEQILKEIIRQHGIEFLRNGADLAEAFTALSQSKEDTQLFCDFVDIRGYIALLDAGELPLLRQMKCYKQTVSKLAQAAGIPEDAAESVCSAFWHGVYGSSTPSEMLQCIYQKRKETAAAILHTVLDFLKSIRPLYESRFPYEQYVILMGSICLAAHLLFCLLLPALPQNRLPVQFTVLEILRILLILLIQYRTLKKGCRSLFPAPSKNSFRRLLHWIYRFVRKSLMCFLIVISPSSFFTLFSTEGMVQMEALMGGLIFWSGIAGILCLWLVSFEALFLLCYLAATK